MGYAGDITPEQAWETLKSDPDAVLVDCRTEAEWTFVGVPDLSGLDKQTVCVEWNSYLSGHNDDFLADLRAAGVNENQHVMFLCRSGQRSVAAAEAATADGFGAAYNILDGFEGGLAADGHRGSTGWRAAGLPWRQQ